MMPVFLMADHLSHKQKSTIQNNQTLMMNDCPQVATVEAITLPQPIVPAGLLASFIVATSQLLAASS